jgi:hypothetical protein
MELERFARKMPYWKGWGKGGCRISALQNIPTLESWLDNMKIKRMPKRLL